MKVLISKEALLKRLMDIQGIVEKKSTMPILSHFLLDLTGKPFIYATDLDTAIREPIDIEPSLKGALAIPARPFISAVKELEGDVNLEEIENFRLKLTSGRSVMEFNCLNPQEFPAWPEISDRAKIVLPSAELKKLIEKTVYAASDTDTRYVLNGILLHAQLSGESNSISGESNSISGESNSISGESNSRGTLTAVGADGHRLAMIRVQIDSDAQWRGDSAQWRGNSSEFKSILPKKAMIELKRLIGNNQELSITAGGNHVLVKTSSPPVEFLTKVIEGTYPEYQQVIPNQASKKVVVKKAELQKALKRVSIISKEMSNAVKFNIEGNVLRISASQPDLGNATEEIDVEYNISGESNSGEPFTIGFNARYILEAIEVMDSEDVIAEFDKPISPALFKGKEDEGYISVIMPMRI